MAIYFFDPVQDLTNLGLYKPFLSACLQVSILPELEISVERPVSVSYDLHTGGRRNRFFALIRVACSRLSVSGGLKKRAGDEWESGREKAEIRSPVLSRIPLAADPALRPVAFSIVLTDREPGTGYS